MILAAGRACAAAAASLVMPVAVFAASSTTAFRQDAGNIRRYFLALIG